MGNSSNKNNIPKECLRPHGLYGECGWDEKIVKRMILQRKLAPCFVGSQECRNKWEEEECPICFLFYPGGLNRALCCNKPICTECYLQIQKPRQQHAQCPFCNRRPYLVEFNGVRSQEEIDEEEEEEQKVLALKIKMQREEEETSRIERQRKNEEATANRQATVALDDIVLETTPSRQQTLPNVSASISANAAVNHHGRTASASSSSSSTSSATRTTTRPSEMYKNFIPSTDSGYPDEESMLNEAIRRSLLVSTQSNNNASSSYNKILGTNNSNAAVSSAAAPSSSSSSSNQPNIFFSSFNFVTNVNITAPSSQPSTSLVEGENPFQLQNSTHFCIPSGSRSSSVTDSGAAATASATTSIYPSAATSTLHLPQLSNNNNNNNNNNNSGNGNSSESSSTLPTLPPSPPAAASSSSSAVFTTPGSPTPSDAESSSSAVALDDEETQLQVAIALSLSLLDEQQSQE